MTNRNVSRPPINRDFVFDDANRMSPPKKLNLQGEDTVFLVTARNSVNVRRAFPDGMKDISLPSSYQANPVLFMSTPTMRTQVHSIEREVPPYLEVKPAPRARQRPNENEALKELGHVDALGRSVVRLSFLSRDPISLSNISMKGKNSHLVVSGSLSVERLFVDTEGPKTDKKARENYGLVLDGNLSVGSLALHVANGNLLAKGGATIHEGKARVHNGRVSTDAENMLTVQTPDCDPRCVPWVLGRNSAR